jgi:hypothetical protein
LHPSLKAAGILKEIYKSDKSAKKNNSSKLLWTIALIWDRDSKYYNLPEVGEDSKIDLLFEDIYGDKDYYKKNRAHVEKLRVFYLNLQETTARRSLREIEEKLEQRSAFLRDTDYDIGIANERGQWIGNTASILDKMLADTKKIYDLYEQARKLVSDEVEKGQAMGGGQESLSDTGDI